MHETAVVVMARYPRKGQTKTRLARSIGEETTVQLYRAFLADIAHHLAGSAIDLYWTYTPSDVDYDALIAELSPALARYTRSFPQQGADFGARLHHAFIWAANKGYKKIIIIGSDSPHIRREMITQAQDALDVADVALGPADDGGYYLLAMRRSHDVFSGIPMSTSVVADMTIAAARSLGLTTRLIEPLFDVDELPDLLRLAHILREDAARAPHTAAVLATINMEREQLAWAR
jgi:rSAM/selenodomain-associated transferase 1